MSIISKFSSIDKKFAWSFSGFILALILGGVSIYTEFVREKRPAVQYEILGSTNILNVEEDVSNLDILYNGVDIKESKMVLSVIVIKILNTGDQDVLNSHYDEKSPLGFALNGGQVVKTEIINASSKYLTDNLKITEIGGGRFVFPKVILEAGESFTIKILDLHSSDVSSTVEPIGKIAGVKDILISDVSDNGDNQSYLLRTFSGNLFVQILRIPAYTLILILLFAGIFVPTMLLTEKIQKKKREKTVKKFKEFCKDEIGNEVDEILDFYSTRGSSSLKRVVKLLGNNSKLEELIERKKSKESNNDDQNVIEKDVIDIHPFEMETRSHFYSTYHLDDLEKLKLLTITEDSFAINEELKESLIEVYNFVKIKEI